MDIQHNQGVSQKKRNINKGGKPHKDIQLIHEEMLIKTPIFTIK
jgi:hypothetical protein